MDPVSGFMYLRRPNRQPFGAVGLVVDPDSSTLKFALSVCHPDDQPVKAISRAAVIGALTTKEGAPLVLNYTVAEDGRIANLPGLAAVVKALQPKLNKQRLTEILLNQDKYTTFIRGMLMELKLRRGVDYLKE